MKPINLMTCILTILCLISILTGASFAADINTTVNETFNITLQSNPSTGYSWNVIYDDNYLELVDDTFQPGVGIGAPGMRTFTFMALLPGETSINFTYLGPGGNIGNTTSYSVLIAGITPANNTTNVTPSNNTTVPMQPTGIPLVVVAVGVLSVAAGVIASKKQ
jgi:predicted secreted protein